MADYGKHEVPDEFQDEDKWFLLTKRQWVVLAPSVVTTIFLIGTLIKAHLAATILFPIVLTGCILFILASLVVAFFDVPDNWYLYGGGMKIERVLFRVLRKKIDRRSKVVYTKHYDNGSERK